ncbi:LysR family transcriptional regulator [Sphingomonas sp. BK235]|nr:LysR family transcriptional regulator [Sphingomonas sp. BK235]
MKLDELVAFVMVADCGSINEAARQLRLSKSTVSERLTGLEQTLGVALLNRNSRQLTLTDDGSALLERARRIVGEAADAREDLARRRGDVAGHVRIAAPRAFGDLHLGPLLYEFMERYPDVAVTADFDDRISDLSKGFDLVVRIAPDALPKLVTEQLTISRRILVAAPSYLERFGMPRSVEELEHHKAIHYTERGPEDWSFKAEIERVVAHVAPRLRVTSCVAMRDAAIAGLGIAWLPTFHTHKALPKGQLQVLDVGLQPDITPITATFRPDPPARLRALLDHLRVGLGDPPYWDDDLPGLSGPAAELGKMPSASE